MILDLNALTVFALVAEERSFRAAADRLGVTRSAVKPIWDETAGEFKPRLMVPLSLSYDHRVIDGASAARFTAHLVNVLSDLRRALL